MKAEIQTDCIQQHRRQRKMLDVFQEKQRQQLINKKKKIITAFKNYCQIFAISVIK